MYVLWCSQSGHHLSHDTRGSCALSHVPSNTRHRFCRQNSTSQSSTFTIPLIPHIYTYTSPWHFFFYTFISVNQHVVQCCERCKRIRVDELRWIWFFLFYISTYRKSTLPIERLLSWTCRMEMLLKGLQVGGFQLPSEAWNSCCDHNSTHHAGDIQPGRPSVLLKGNFLKSQNILSGNTWCFP